MGIYNGLEVKSLSRASIELLRVRLYMLLLNKNISYITINFSINIHITPRAIPNTRDSIDCLIFELKKKYNKENISDANKNDVQPLITGIRLSEDKEKILVREQGKLTPSFEENTKEKVLELYTTVYSQIGDYIKYAEDELKENTIINIFFNNNTLTSIGIVIIQLIYNAPTLIILLSLIPVLLSTTYYTIKYRLSRYRSIKPIASLSEIMKYNIEKEKQLLNTQHLEQPKQTLGAPGEVVVNNSPKTLEKSNFNRGDIFGKY